MKLRYHIIIFVCFLIFFNLFSRNPENVEYWYTQQFYLSYSRFMLAVTSYFSFSVGDILYIIAGVYILYRIIRIFKKHSLWKFRLLHTAKIGIKFCLIFYMLFNITWGLNNYNFPILHQLNIETIYTDEDLEKLIQKIIFTTNLLHAELINDSLQALQIEKSTEEIIKDGSEGLKNLADETNWFTYRTLSVKKSIFSLPLTYMGFSGYINPFTTEAQVNYMIPKTTLIVTTSHEMSHQLGYAKESEANFIGFLAAHSHSDKKYVYASNIFALRYCLNTLAKNNPDKTEEYLSHIYPGVIDNLTENTIFWSNYKGITDSFFKFFYSNFLKINNQKEGIHSYNKFVALLINYDKAYKLYPSFEN